MGYFLHHFRGEWTHTNTLSVPPDPSHRVQFIESSSKSLPGCHPTASIRSIPLFNMISKTLFSAVCGLSVGVQAFALPQAPPACIENPCLQAFKAAIPRTRPAEASSFCSAFLSTSVPAVTVTASTTRINTVTATGADVTQRLTASTVRVTVTPPVVTITVDPATFFNTEFPEPFTLNGETVSTFVRYVWYIE